MAVSEISFVVRGLPAPKGSARAAGNQVIPSGSPQNRIQLANWSSVVREAATREVARLGSEGVIPFMKVPVGMKIVFRMKRPGHHFVKKGANAGQVRADAPTYHITKPDASKLLRAFEDDLTGLIWIDDAQVCMPLVRKIYGAPGSEGCTVKLWRLDP